MKRVVMISKTRCVACGLRLINDGYDYDDEDQVLCLRGGGL